MMISLDGFFTRLNVIVSNIRGFNESVEDSTVVKKILRILPDKFDGNVSSLEDIDTGELSLDDLHSCLVAYEMRKAPVF